MCSSDLAKRARQAASAVGRAMADEAMAKTMHAVAEHLESGEAEHLTGVSQKTHLEALDAALRSARHKRFKDNYSEFERRQYDPYTDDDIKFAEWPWPAVHFSSISDVVNEAKGRKGVEQLRDLANEVKASLHGVPGADHFGDRKSTRLNSSH